MSTDSRATGRSLPSAASLRHSGNRQGEGWYASAMQHAPRGVLACFFLLALALRLGPASAEDSPLPAERAVSAPLLRVGLRQGQGSVALSCPAGIRVQDPEGHDLLEAGRSIRIHLPGAVAPGTDPPHEEQPREATTPDGDQQPVIPAEPQPAPPAAAPNGNQKMAAPPGAAARAMLAVTVLGAGGGADATQLLPFASLRIVAKEAQVPLEMGKARYRGVLLVDLVGTSRLSVVNLISVEEYLRGVLPSEMSPSAPAEALKAQAIVARTFAVCARDRHRTAGFALCDGTHCQVYAGASRECEATDRAVLETRGQVLVSEGKLVPAYFHSTCGGATDSATDVWGGRQAPACLAGVSDAVALSSGELFDEAGILSLVVRGPEFLCGGSREFSWELERTRGELEAVFSRALSGSAGKPARLGRLQAITVLSRTRTGRATTLEVRGSEGSCVIRGESIRRAFGTGKQALPSTRFVVRPVEDPAAPKDAPPERYRIFGFGSGHGVGMCQSGAVGMARRGSAAAAILSHYFPGATVAAIEASGP